MRRTVIGLTGLVAFALPFSGVAATNSNNQLLDAVKTQDWETARSLITQHADVNATRPDGSSALAWAAHWNDLATVKLLIASDANVNASNAYGDTALWEACNNIGAAAIVEELAKAGANPDATLLKTGETALMRCAHTGDPAAVKSLLSRGADVNAKEKEKNQTALMWAIEESHPEVARMLIEAGADIKVKSKGSFSPLMFAARQGDLPTAKLLVERGADVNETTQGDGNTGRATARAGGLSVLLIAADSGNEDFAQYLVEKGANPNAADSDGYTALHYSLRKGISILRYVHHDNNYNDSFDYLFRPPMTGLVKTLLAHGADPNVRVKKGTTLTSMLHPSDRPMLGLPGATPFLFAAASGDVEVMKILLAKGADPKPGTYDGVTPLMAAAGYGRRDEYTKQQEQDCLDAVKLLVGLGADVNATNKDGRTALQGAAFGGADTIIQYLVEHGGRLDMKDRWGQTPLSIAEGDPNNYMDDHERCIYHETTVALIRKLGGDLTAEFSATASQTNSAAGSRN
jgi:ankyrin repeat protein